MTLLLVSLLAGLESGGAEVAEESFNSGPYIAAGICLAILFGAMIGLLIFGKGREHS